MFEKSNNYFLVSDRTTDLVSDDEGDGVEEEGSSCSSNDNETADDDERDDEAEDEDISTLPDNVSDVAPISANVSARGSPSLSGERNSGRGTPFSNNAHESNGILFNN